MIDLAIVATTFALILPAELPDKTFIATLVLATRSRYSADASQRKTFPVDPAEADGRGRPRRAR